MNFQKGRSSWEKGNRVSQRPDSSGNKKTRTNLKKKKEKKREKQDIWVAVPKRTECNLIREVPANRSSPDRPSKQPFSPNFFPSFSSFLFFLNQRNHRFERNRAATWPLPLKQSSNRDGGVDGVFNLSERNDSRATINKYIPRKLSEEEQIYIYIYIYIYIIYTHLEKRI